MYRAAAVQNTDEMLRYGWADIRTQLDSDLCNWDVYSGDDIGDLIRRLDRLDYDALILPTNVCLDQRVRNALENNRTVIEKFLANERGLFMSFQRGYLGQGHVSFLPEIYDLGVIRRQEEGKEGHLAPGNPDAPHPLLAYPYQVTIDEITRHCLENEFARNFYIGYLSPTAPTNYDTVVVDDKYGEPRQLLISSRTDLSARVVVSAMPLDWQNHERLLQNVIRYVVQGIPQIAVLEKVGNTSSEIRYLTANLRINKIAYAEYLQRRLELGSIPLDIHRQIILSPSWHLSDLHGSDLQNRLPHLEGGTKLYYFQSLFDSYPVVSTVGGRRQSDVMTKNVIPWLLSKYREGSWDGSFWTTVDILETLRYFNYPIGHFGDEIVKRIEPHDKDGSYDEVVVASCALLRLYSWFLGRDDVRYKRCLAWLEGRRSQLQLYELAAVIETLVELHEPIQASIIDTFCYEAVRRAEIPENEVRLYQYAKTLLAVGRITECRTTVKQLAKQQGADGRWSTLALTASVVSLLLELSRQSNTTDHELEEMIFEGVLYLKDQYLPESFCWGFDTTATARCICAVHAFGDVVSVPVDEVLTSLGYEVTWSRNYAALDISAELNHRLLVQAAELEAKVDDAKVLVEEGAEEARQHNLRAARLERITAIAAILVLPILAFTVMLVIYVIYKGKSDALGHFMGQFVKDWSAAIFAALPIGPLVVIYLLVRRFLPHWLGGPDRRPAP